MRPPQVPAGLDERLADLVVGQLFEEINLERAGEVVRVSWIVERPLLVREQVSRSDRDDRVVEPAPKACVEANGLPQRVEVAVLHDEADADRPKRKSNV